MSTRGRVLLAVGIGIGVLIVVAAARRPSVAGDPLDPQGTGQLGARALVLLLSEGGADTRVSARPPDSSRSTAVVLRDTFDETRRAAITDWVKAGGTLVVADPRSPLGLVAPYLSPINGSDGAHRLDDACGALPALSGLHSIDASGALVYSKEDRQAGAVGCFGTKDGDFLVATPLGSGTVVALGGAGLWVNANLDQRGNAGLAVALLAPSRGTRVQIVSDLAADAGDIGIERPKGRGILSVLPRGARAAGVQLGIAFAVAALWRGRRLGRPVPESQPVVIPGSELVAAVGHLHQKSGHRRTAAAVLSARARRAVADRFGLPRTTAPADLAAMAGARSDVDTTTALTALAPTDPSDDAALVRVAAASDSVCRAIDGKPRTQGEIPW